MEFLDYAVEPHGYNAPIGRNRFNDVEYRTKWENQNFVNHHHDFINHHNDEFINPPQYYNQLE